MNAQKALDEYLQYCEKIRTMAKTTVRAKRSLYGEYFRYAGISRLKQMNHKNINKFMIHIATTRNLSPNCLHHYASQIIVMVKYFQLMGYPVNVQMPLITVPRKPLTYRRVFYYKNELMEVLKYADEQTALMIRIAFDTGIRVSALCQLRLSNFYGRMLVYVDKGNKKRESYVTDETFELLNKFIKKNNITDYLFGGMYAGTGVSKSTVTNKMRIPFYAYANYLRESNSDDSDLITRLEAFHVHALRHSFATDLQRSGASLMEIKELMGHSKATVTEDYLHGFEGRLSEIFDKYKNNNENVEN